MKQEDIIVHTKTSTIEPNHNQMPNSKYIWNKKGNWIYFKSEKKIMLNNVGTGIDISSVSQLSLSLTKSNQGMSLKVMVNWQIIHSIQNFCCFKQSRLASNQP